MLAIARRWHVRFPIDIEYQIAHTYIRPKAGFCEDHLEAQRLTDSDSSYPWYFLFALAFKNMRICHPGKSASASITITRAGNKNFGKMFDLFPRCTGVNAVLVEPVVVGNTLGGKRPMMIKRGVPMTETV